MTSPIRFTPRRAFRCADFGILNLDQPSACRLSADASDLGLRTLSFPQEIGIYSGPDSLIVDRIYSNPREEFDLAGEFEGMVYSNLFGSLTIWND